VTGTPDLFIGAPYDDANGSSSGSAYVYSGMQTARLLYQLQRRFSMG
jgi:hypothetical protein